MIAICRRLDDAITSHEFHLVCRDNFHLLSKPGEHGLTSKITVARRLRVGKEGVITIEEGASVEFELGVVEGMQFDRGYLSPYFVTNSEKMTVELEDLVIDRQRRKPLPVRRQRALALEVRIRDAHTIAQALVKLTEPSDS